MSPPPPKQNPKVDVMTLFTRSLKSPYTRKSYTIELKKYMKFVGVEQPEELLKLTQDSVIAYILKLEEEGKAHGSRQLALAAIKHFYEINDVVFNWKKISKFLGEPKKTVEDRGYTTAEIMKLLLKCDERKRVVVLTFASSGMRLGGLAGLRFRDLQKTKNGIYRITVYARTKAKYTTFCSLECTEAIDAYLEYRQRFGERLTGESPLIRNQFDKTVQKEAENSKPVKEHSIRWLILELLQDSGLREKPLETMAYKRKEIMAVHGFRKFFATALNQAYDNKNPLMVEMLLGHDTGLTGVYTKPTDEVKEDFYIGGVDALTVSDENRLRNIVRAQEKSLNEVQEMIEWYRTTQKKAGAQKS